MLLVTTTFSIVVGILSTVAYAEPQPPPGSRPIYINGGQGHNQHNQHNQIPRQPQFQPSPQIPVSYSQGPSSPLPQSYQRPSNNYIINSTPKPISHQSLPSPSPVQPPIARQQLPSPPRPSTPSSSGSSNRYSSSLGEVQPVYGNAPSYVPQSNVRNRYQPSPQQQSKYSSQLKAGGAQGSKQNQLTSEEAEYEEELEQEPDRLTLLLQESKFQCGAKKDGYYADTGLNCEVFHYCNAGAKHSWMCPNNFAFHQVHLICVPPSSDDICKQSENFHFVNEYLYRPINEKEAQATNTSLKYADRYYPDGYTPGTPLDEMVANYDSSHHHPEPRAPHSFKAQQQRQPPQAYHGGNGNGGDRNVFFSPESINIPLAQRRPQVHRAGPASAKQNSPQSSPKNYNNNNNNNNNNNQNNKYEDEEYEDEY